jgi:hypothetical protein
MNMAIGGCGLLGFTLAAGSSWGAATLVADYQFHGNYASAVAGAPNLVPINTVTFTTASINGHVTDVAAFTAGSGLRMDVPASFTSGQYTIIFQVSLDTVSGYRKLIDFKDRTQDEGLYNLGSILDFFPPAEATSEIILAGAFAQVALTRDASGQVVGYVDGLRQFSFDDSATQYGVLATSSFNLFIDDIGTGSEDSSGIVARARLYSGAMTGAEVVVASESCYANCDGSTTTPLLNVQDFTCFFQKFAIGDPYANCDGSTGTPVLNVQDFTCFLQKFAQACP